MADDLHSKPKDSLKLPTAEPGQRSEKAPPMDSPAVQDDDDDDQTSDDLRIAS